MWYKKWLNFPFKNVDSLVFCLHFLKDFGDKLKVENEKRYEMISQVIDLL